MAMKVKTCTICGEDAECAGLCAKHYSYVWRWQNEGVSRAMKHRDKLVQRQQCLDIVRPSNVVHLPRRKRA